MNKHKYGFREHGFGKYVVAAWAGWAAGMADGVAETRPNLLVVMTDDLRIEMLGSDGHPFMRTPNLDRIPQEGIRFNNAYALSPICGPSRANIFTGQHTSVHMRRDNLWYPDEYEQYLPQYFKDAGYTTAMIGKYYKGGPFAQTARKAFDRWFVWQGNPDPMPPANTPEFKDWFSRLYIDDMYAVDHERKQILGHQTDILFDEAARFMTENKDKPLMVFLSPFAPHMPFNMTERNKGLYRGKGLPPRENHELDEGYWTNPDHRVNLVEWYEQYCEMIADIDDGMGRLLQALEENGQLDNTVIILTSDNGYMFGEHGFAWKRHPWQESVRVPFYVRYPRVVEPGTESDALICLADIFFTCADLGGVPIPEIRGQAGTSIVPVLAGEKPNVRDSLLMMQYEQLQTLNERVPDVMLWAGLIRADGWKLAMYNVPPEQRPETDPTLFFQLSRDEFELDNLAEHPEYRPVFEELKTQMEGELGRADAVLFPGSPGPIH